MSDLGREAQELIQAGRVALRPTAADRERILALLRGHSGPVALAPAMPKAPVQLGWPMLSAVVVGLGTVGFLVAASTLERAQAPALAPPIAVSVSAALPASAPAAAMLPASDSPESSAPLADQKLPTAENRGRASKRPADRLAEEVEVLSRAQTEMHAGRFTAALKLLEEHARTFPRGALTPERRAARVQALCALGQKSEADAELARLPPGSLHEARAREACATRVSSKAQ